MRVLYFILTAFLFASSSYAQPEWRIFGPTKQYKVYPVVLKIDAHSALIAGGYTQEVFSSPTNSTEILRIKGGTVEHVLGPEMPTARAEFPFVRMNDSLLIAIGGFTSGGGVSRAVDAYNTRTNQWRTIGNLREGRRQHVAYKLDDENIVVVGGRNENLTTKSSAEVFNTSDWRKCSD